MPSDLDRAYVINGDDLRIALGKHAGRLALPEQVARVVLKEVARPLEGGQPGVYPVVPVSEPMLADALQAAGVGSPVTTAETVFARLDERWRATLAGPPVPLPAPEDEPDAELAAMAVIVSALDALDDAEVARVLRWARDRYGD